MAIVTDISLKKHISKSQLNELTSIFRDLTGIDYSDNKLYLFENRLSKFIDGSKGCNSYEELIRELKEKDNIELKKAG